jgi:hypothetical protein
MPAENGRNHAKLSFQGGPHERVHDQEPVDLVIETLVKIQEGIPAIKLYERFD